LLESEDNRGMESDKTKESIVQELGRRRIVQVALLYFAIAWTATEVLSFLFEAIPVFPAWSKTLVALLFVLGFPVAMFLTWRFDIGPGGIQRTEAATRRGKLTIVVALAMLVASTAGLFYLIYPHVQEQNAGVTAAIFDPPENSIAIMMFLNTGGDPGNEYFSQGVPDAILHKLANLKDLVVIARTSSFALSAGGLDAKTIGKELNVRYLLEGSVQRVGENLRIISQLINTTDATHVWSLDQRLVLDDIFAVQDEIALEITRALRLSLQDEERERLLANGTTSVPAYLAYLRGNYA
jgi:TolB-like protein